MDLNERCQHSEKVYDGKLLQIYRDLVTLANGHEEVREVIRHPGAAVVVPHLGKGRYLLVRQFRYALRRETLEFPAGRLEPGEQPLDCARRELREETGYIAQRWTHLFSLHPAPGYSDELLEIFLAEGLTAGPSQPDEDEQVLAVQVSLKELLERFKAGRITDAKTNSALLYLKAFPQEQAL